MKYVIDWLVCRLNDFSIAITGIDEADAVHSGIANGWVLTEDLYTFNPGKLTSEFLVWGIVRLFSSTVPGAIYVCILW